MHEAEGAAKDAADSAALSSLTCLISIASTPAMNREAKERLNDHVVKLNPMHAFQGRSVNL